MGEIVSDTGIESRGGGPEQAEAGQSPLSSRKRLIENMLSLGVLQGANFILPLITLPYLLRVLGPEKFGLIAFAQAFNQYFVMITDYGFNLTATRRIAINREDIAMRSEIFCAVFVIKLALMLLSFVTMAGVVLLVPKFRADWPIYFVSFLAVLGSVIFPVWFFQGMERMKHIAVLNICAKFIAVPAIFLLVRRQSDYLLAAGIQSSVLAVAGFLGLASIRRVATLRLARPSRQTLIEAMAEGWHVFISTAAINVYTTSNTFILGLITNTSAVGYFSAADKLVKAVHGAMMPVTQAIYPHINALASRSRDGALAFIRKSLRWLGILSLALSSMLFVLAPVLVRIVFGPKYESSVVLLRWMAFLPFIVALSNVFGAQTLLTFGMHRLFSRILILSGLVNLLLIFPLIHLLGAEGAAISLLLTEVVVTVSMGVALERRGFHLFASRVKNT